MTNRLRLVQTTHGCWAVVRCRDSAVLMDGFSSVAEALLWLEGRP